MTTSPPAHRSENASSLWLDHPATVEEVRAICAAKAFRIGYQAAFHGIPFNADLFHEEREQRRYEEGREIAFLLRVDGEPVDWPLGQADPPQALIAVLLQARAP